MRYSYLFLSTPYLIMKVFTSGRMNEGHVGYAQGVQRLGRKITRDLCINGRLYENESYRVRICGTTTDV
jgi:hypothetical protein